MKTNCTRSAILIAVAAACLATGCTRSNTLAESNAAPARGERVALKYELLAGEFSSACRQGESAIEQAAYPPIESPGANAKGTLTIESPSPSGRPGMALARLQSATRDPEARVFSSDPKERIEYWSLDLPRDELEAVLAALRAQSFFTKQGRFVWASRITVETGGAPTSKRWGQVIELNRIAQLARRHGRHERIAPGVKPADVQLASSPPPTLPTNHATNVANTATQSAPAGSTADAGDLPPSLAAYQQWQAEQRDLIEHRASPPGDVRISRLPPIDTVPR